MILKQYVITLPADYDMTIIRNRVAAKGPAFDGFPGLGLKAFMIRERGRFGAESNQYAPVYLWPAVAPIWSFLAGDGFAGIIDSFGRVPVYYWLGLAFSRGEIWPSTALRSVTRTAQDIPPGTDLKDLRATEIEAARSAAETSPDLAARAVGLNAENWSLVRFDFWARPQEVHPAGTHSYEVLHVSAPDPDALQST